MTSEEALYGQRGQLTISRCIRKMVTCIRKLIREAAPSHILLFSIFMHKLVCLGRLP